MTLHDRILELKQGHSGYGHNGILFSFSLDMCQKIDIASASDPFAEKTVKQVLRLLKGYQVGYSEKLKSAFEVYSEYAIFHEIMSKNIPIERVLEGKQARPDFKVSIGDEYLYLEAKVLGWASGGIQHNASINDGIDAQISIEEQIRNGKTVAFSETEISPLGSTNESIENPEKYFIEAISAKLSQNVKSAQLKLGPTFLICDLTSLNHPSDHRKSSVIVHNDNIYGSFSSGELWHIAFGQHGDRILKAIEFEGKSNVSGKLQLDGVLVEHEELIGVIFRVSKLSGECSYSCLIKSEYFDKYGELVTQLSNCWNDEKNSNAWALLSSKN
ncbi:hypothetical protein M0J40_RS16850 [Providencia rettgeri]|nr:hypothetical protein [Providencia rettgeri]ELR5126931.1 hypothetical protein [Providencia rettgeri]ELR5246028.1 hypothetical protein [Providencia rettgeri]ELS4585122.1 hypothetical protein [Providencia rettgeri]